MKPIRIFHNPRCSRSDQTMALAESSGVKPDVLEYLKQSPDFAELDSIPGSRGIEPRQPMRSHEKACAENRPDEPAPSREVPISAMIAEPALIERPIVIRVSRINNGRPPEKVRDSI